jgi:CubicO group peptidase (beta-lactamase class C family)
VNDPVSDTYLGCGNLSSTTYYHTGYTGTLVCNDPERQLITVLLTNRVWPNKTANMGTIQLARQAFNNAVKAVVDQMMMGGGGVVSDGVSGINAHKMT